MDLKNAGNASGVVRGVTGTNLAKTAFLTRFWPFRTPPQNKKIRS